MPQQWNPNSMVDDALKIVEWAENSPSLVSFIDLRRFIEEKITNKLMEVNSFFRSQNLFPMYGYNRFS